MEERQRKIKARLDDAERARSTAENERSRLEDERANLERAREAALDDAREQAATLRRELEQKARAELDEARAAGRAQLARESEEFLDTLRREAARQFDALARAAFADLADAELEDRVAAAFAEKLEAIDPHDRDALAKAAREADGVAVESAFDLNADARRRVTRAIHEFIAPEVEIEYARAERLTCGVRLRVGGRVAEWTLDSYLDRFEDELNKTLAETLQQTTDKAAE
jgi:F0F1-type ATP synthase membrane subunit b/b'